MRPLIRRVCATVTTGCRAQSAAAAGKDVIESLARASLPSLHGRCFVGLDVNTTSTGVVVLDAEGGSGHGPVRRGRSP